MKFLLSILFVLTTLTLFSQQKKETNSYPPVFDSLISHYEYYFGEEQPLQLPVLHNGPTYKLVLGQEALHLSLTDTVLADTQQGYPLSYSVIFRDHIVSLFEPGKFYCYSLTTLSRNADLENKLNTRPFSYHWLLNNQLVARSGEDYYYFATDSTWKPVKHPMIPYSTPKLFEDEMYICYSSCSGEWGGTLYFYNKKNKQTYYTEATCANTVIKKEGKYYVLAHLGHMEGFTTLKMIKRPDLLPQLRKAPGRNDSIKYAGWPGNTIKENTYDSTIIDLMGVQFFSTFTINNRTVYLIHDDCRTFLAEKSGNTYTILHPLFNSALYTHEPVTTEYASAWLVNMDFGRIGKDREIALLLIRNNKITRINWGRLHKF
ncbi:MAG: hypothetical protein P0Y53_21025 [Candidatus Pseudobacter hemicellulosilyticus]|uniref:Uncharacterized protein n=1 Tax=Candidatus Pseudobacter hemicellulosilyticus TaxID=3121375 RepID=A0AAJ5WRX5_9BACT|nr:MAG: hypothetical protein P0Y53_21025 [Pseudobacter sp.]